jgi:predicted  nucleic acid-binding Zn-ribbon protein
MSMIRNAVFAALLLTSGATQALAASEADFKAAYEAAKTAENHAAALHNRWTTTEAALAAAKTAAAAGDFAAAIAAAKDAEALAKASIFQATSEKERWKDAEIR